MVIRGKNPALDLRASLGITPMLPRSTGMKGDTIGTGVRGRAPLSVLTKASTTGAAAQDTAGTGADTALAPAALGTGRHRRRRPSSTPALEPAAFLAGLSAVR